MPTTNTNVSAPGAASAMSGNPSPPMVLTVTQACEALKVSRWSIYELIRTRQLVTIKIGRRRLIPATAVHVLVERLSAEEALR